jgi:hypothetical protein
VEWLPPRDLEDALPELSGARFLLRSGGDGTGAFEAGGIGEGGFGQPPGV